MTIIRSLLGLPKLKGIKRGEAESFEDYKKRRSAENRAMKVRRRGTILWQGKNVYRRKCPHCSAVSTKEMACSNDNCGKNLTQIVKGQGPYSLKEHGKIGRKLKLQ